ncbi:MAG TPA: hypothetical protein VNW54_15885 [Granulicella sp.]|nr:hypothetical protein [Granulicella sp.]
MKVFETRLWWGLLFCCASLCLGQTKAPVLTNVAPAPSARFPASWYPKDSDVGLTEAPQTDAPYTATLVTRVEFLNPKTGERKSLSQSTLQARDGTGRTREEQSMPRPDGHGGTAEAREVTVSDPVSHCSFRSMEPWEGPGEPTAMVSCMSRTVHYSGQNMWADAMVNEPKEERSVNEVSRSEPLGRRMFGDPEASGMRRTRSQTNAQTGKVATLEIEIWYSAELKELLAMTFPVADTGAAVGPLPGFELTNVRRGEPDAALFDPPNGYRIVLEHPVE